MVVATRSKTKRSHETFSAPEHPSTRSHTRSSGRKDPSPTQAPPSKKSRVADEETPSKGKGKEVAPQVSSSPNNSNSNASSSNTSRKPKTVPEARKPKNGTFQARDPGAGETPDKELDTLMRTIEGEEEEDAAPAHVAWEGMTWCRVSGTKRTTYRKLQDEWLTLYIELLRRLKADKGAFHALLLTVEVLDFCSVLIFERPFLSCPGVCLDIGMVPYLRVWSVLHHRIVDDATVVDAEAKTLVLLGKTPVESLPQLAPPPDQKPHYELAIVPRPTNGKFQRVVVHLGKYMAPKASYGFLRDTEALVLVVDDLQETDPGLIADLLALNLIPAAWWDSGERQRWYPVEGGERGRLPHLTIVGDGQLSKQHVAALAERLEADDLRPTLVEYIRAFEETYGAETLDQACEMLTFEEYEEHVGKEAYAIEMGAV